MYQVLCIPMITMNCYDPLSVNAMTQLRRAGKRKSILFW